MTEEKKVPIKIKIHREKTYGRTQYSLVAFVGNANIVIHFHENSVEVAPGIIHAERFRVPLSSIFTDGVPTIAEGKL